MTKNPLVSIIIIFLNSQDYIEQAIESVFAQTYQHWELLLVDDGSTDASTLIAKHYEEKSPGRVLYLEHPGHKNRGMSASRNLGMRHAIGKYVSFLDADDVWLPPKLEHQAAILESQPKAAMVYGNTQYWYGWTGRAEDKKLDFVPKLGVRSNNLYKPPALLPLFLEGKAAVPCTCSILVRREALERVGGFEECFRDLYEDQAFYAKISLEMPIFVSDKCLEKYRQHPEQSCSVAEARLRQTNFARLEYLEWTASYLSKRAFTDTQVWQTLHRELWLYRHLRTPYLPACTLNLVRWIKKWLLLLEERFMPRLIRRRLWS